jgi:hypothetical protein
MKALQLMVREGCHLCDEFEDLLEHHPLRSQFELERVVINNRADLEALYGTKVPVLLGESSEICHYFIDQKALKEYLLSA